MAGIIEQRYVGCGQRAGELTDLGVEGALVEIGADQHLEADLFQGRRHVTGVVGGIGEAAGAGIGAVADDQRQPFLGSGGRSQTPTGNDDGDREAKAHAEPHGTTMAAAL